MTLPTTSAEGPSRRPARAGERARDEARRIMRGVGVRLLQAGRVDIEGFDPRRPPTGSVAVYFPDDPERLYQLDQWLPVLEDLHTTHDVVVVLRHVATYRQLAGTLPFPVVLVPRYEDLMALYERTHFRVVLYVNNGWANFQSLAYQPAAHIHINHGESDKLCMVSNQAKAYDRVFVAGQAAIDRHRAALAWFDLDRLVPVGRPQLDIPRAPALPPTGRRTVLYAPTWEGEDEANNYTSVDRYGPALVEAALALPDVRVVYKPHPRVITSRTPAIRSGHRAVVERIRAAAAADPAAGHRALDGGDVLALMAATDLLVTDVSSVGLDFLYLRPGSPIVVSDRRNDRAALLAESPMAAAAHVLDAASLPRLRDDLAQLLDSDTQGPARAGMREYYFGDAEPGSSLARFRAAITEVADEHERALDLLTRRRGAHLDD